LETNTLPTMRRTRGCSIVLFGKDPLVSIASEPDHGLA